jgi:superfamily II DNA helicase RecQ
MKSNISSSRQFLAQAISFLFLVRRGDKMSESKKWDEGVLTTTKKRRGFAPLKYISHKPLTDSKKNTAETTTSPPTTTGLLKRPRRESATEEELMAALNKWFGYSAFRGHQKEVVQSVLGGEDALVVRIAFF